MADVMFAQGSRRREQLAAARLEVKQQPSGVDEELLTFHTELTETCIDLMARHTFSSCAALPRRCSRLSFCYKNQNKSIKT
jgi:tuberous sclerosis protein 2